MKTLLQWARTEPGMTGAEDMRKRPRRNHSAAFKAKVALAAVKGDKTVAEIAQQYEVHPTQVADWRRQLHSHRRRVQLQNLQLLGGG